MPPPKFGLFYVQGLFPQGNERVTTSKPNQSRSESVVFINPVNNDNLIAASKQFINPQNYQFTIGVSYSMDGGDTWTPSFLSPVSGSDGMTDPALTFDNIGYAFIVAEPWKYVTDQNGVSQLQGMGMYVYRSIDGGITWSQPTPIHPTDSQDDKQWIVCDLSTSSIGQGNLYACWGATFPLRFSRSLDHGATWIGVGSSISGTAITTESVYAPEITVGYNGIIHIAWHTPGTGEIRYTRSTDFGNTFEAVQTIVSNVQSLTNFLPITDNWPHFPNATFRVMTLVTACAAAGNRIIVAWADYRENVSRIYYRMTDSYGNWTGPASGQAMLPNTYIANDQHHFHPQIISAGSGVIGCAFYEFGPKNGGHLIDVKIAASFNDGVSFDYLSTITDDPWDPAINAPLSHGDPNVTFIGEYFGIDADSNTFAVVWTDTRTGVQELFFSLVGTVKEDIPNILRGIVAEIIYGVVNDGGGLVFINGKFIRVPPRSPEYDVMLAVQALDAAKQMNRKAGVNLERAAYLAIAAIASEAAKNLPTAEG